MDVRTVLRVDAMDSLQEESQAYRIRVLNLNNKMEWYDPMQNDGVSWKILTNY